MNGAEAATSEVDAADQPAIVLADHDVLLLPALRKRTEEEEEEEGCGVSFAKGVSTTSNRDLHHHAQSWPHFDGASPGDDRSPLYCRRAGCLHGRDGGDGVGGKPRRQRCSFGTAQPTGRLHASSIARCLAPHAFRSLIRSLTHPTQRFGVVTTALSLKGSSLFALTTAHPLAARAQRTRNRPGPHRHEEGP